MSLSKDISTHNNLSSDMVGVICVLGGIYSDIDDLLGFQFLSKI